MENEQAFYDKGFELTELSEYHCRISHPESKVMLDFWPTTQKCLKVNAGQGVKADNYYSDEELLDRAVKTILF